MAITSVGLGEPFAGEVATDRAASRRIAAPARCERHDENHSVHFSDHEPVSGWLGWIEEWIADPHVAYVVEAEVRVLEEMSRLRIDLERLWC
ncbi:hypothetical protein NODU109028_14395 [Nocardioides dubius]|uniref:Uncharacterized protein n=1 Tax=Nocardioides dubius TaxID=317019 RepID=A0ABP4EHS7_9ACTN